LSGSTAPAIAIDVDHALRADEVFRRLDYHSIDVTVNAGVVLLQGHATTPVSRAWAERAARDVRGVLAVTNQIVTDSAESEQVRGRPQAAA
jgi:osmotically-inducible protein OsmY